MTFIKLNLSELEEVSDMTGFPLKEYKIKVRNKETDNMEDKWVAHDLLDLYLRSACEEFELTDDAGNNGAYLYRQIYILEVT